MQDSDNNKKTSAAMFGIPYIRDREFLYNESLPQSGAELVKFYKSMIGNPAIASCLDFYAESLASSIIGIGYKKDETISDIENRLLETLEASLIEDFKKILKNKSENYFLYGINIFDFALVPYNGFTLPYRFSQLQPETITIERDRRGEIVKIIQKLNNGELINIEANKTLIFFRNQSSYAINGISLFAKVYNNYRNSSLAMGAVPNLIKELENGVMIGVTGLLEGGNAKFMDNYNESIHKNNCKPSMLSVEGEAEIKYYSPPSAPIMDMLNIESIETKKIYQYLLIGQQNLGQDGAGGSYALGDVMFNQFKMIFQGILNGIESQLNEFTKDTVLKNNPLYTGKIPSISINMSVTAESLIKLISDMNLAGINTSQFNINSLLLELTPLELNEGEENSNVILPRKSEIAVSNPEEGGEITESYIDESPKAIQFDNTLNPAGEIPKTDPPKRKGTFSIKRELTEAEKESSNIEKYSDEMTKWGEKFGKSLKKAAEDTVKETLSKASSMADLKTLSKNISRDKIKEVLYKAVPKLAEVSFQSVKSDYKKQKGDEADTSKLKAFSSSSGMEGLKEWFGKSSVVFDNIIDFENWVSDDLDAYADMIAGRIEAEIQEKIRVAASKKADVDVTIASIFQGLESELGESFNKEAEKIGGELVGAFRQEALGSQEVTALIRTEIYDKNTCEHCKERDNKIYYFVPSSGLYIASDGEEAVDLPDIVGCAGGIKCRGFYLYKFI